jgi:DNA-binding MarR family transcriptional regulator
LDVAGDRRAYRVQLTPAGRAQFAAMAQQHEAWIVDAFAALSEKEVATLHRLLGRVKAHSQIAAASPPGPSTHLSLETL